MQNSNRVLHQPARAATLVEVMVTMLVFSLLTGITFAVLQLNQKSERKTTLQAEAYRTSALVMRHIRQELLGAEISLTVEDGPQSELSYKIPQWSDARLIVDARGLPIWGEEHQLSTQSNGNFVLLKSGETRLLGKLGAGSVTFQMADSQILQVVVHVELSRDDSPRPEKSVVISSLAINLAKSKLWENISVLEAF